jgi:hypothetical protein
MSLWIELNIKFQDAFDADQQSLIRQILAYAKWCWKAKDGETVNAVACGFYEHLSAHRGMRAEIPQWFTRHEFTELREVFAYHAGQAAVEEIEAEYRHART